ncbi:MAG: hemerythrin domain-containing protein [Elusimicrobia bacterium]|nr:hemerythrin domain-containing protein [Elusimicrobiota bacterium]
MPRGIPMEQANRSVRETLMSDHRVFERLADAVDRSRLRSPGEMRELLAATLDVLVSALEAHEGLEETVLSDVPGPRSKEWEKARRTAELQHDGIASLIKDMRIIVSDPSRYRSEHLSSLALLLAKDLREHVAHEETTLLKDLPALDRAVAAGALDAQRRVQAMLGRMP